MRQLHNNKKLSASAVKKHVMGGRFHLAINPGIQYLESVFQRQAIGASGQVLFSSRV